MEFGCDPEEFYKEYPNVRLRGTIWPKPKEMCDKCKQRKWNKHCADVLQKMDRLLNIGGQHG